MTESDSPEPEPPAPDEDDELLPEEGRSLFTRLVPPGSGRRLGLARALVVGPGLAICAGVAPLIVLSTGTRGVGEQLAALVMCAIPLLILGAGGGLASGLAERRLADRPVLRWAALIAAPGLLTWLLSLQLVYVVGVSRAGVQGGYERLGAFVDPTSRDAVMALTLSLGAGLGLGLALAQVVQRRLRGEGLRAQMLGVFGVLVRGMVVVGCGGCVVLGVVATAFAALGIKDELQGQVGQGAIMLWMSSFASLTSLGILAALLGPWLLLVADRLEARWAATPGAPRP